VWKKYRAPDLFLNLNNALERQVENTLAYAVCYVMAPEEMPDLILKVGSDDHTKIYLNGKEVYRFESMRGTVMDQDAISHLTLKKGINVLVMKLIIVNGEWSACVRFFGKEGRPVQNLTFSTNRPN